MLHTSTVQPASQRCELNCTSHGHCTSAATAQLADAALRMLRCRLSAGQSLARAVVTGEGQGGVGAALHGGRDPGATAQCPEGPAEPEVHPAERGWHPPVPAGRAVPPAHHRGQEPAACLCHSHGAVPAQFAAAACTISRASLMWQLCRCCHAVVQQYDVARHALCWERQARSLSAVRGLMLRQ